MQVDPDTYKGFFPPAMGEEMLENHLFVEKPGYYDGASLEPSLALLEEKPTTWKEFAQRNFA